MAQLSRRDFILQGSTSLLYATTHGSHSLITTALSSRQEASVEAGNAIKWNPYGRLELHQKGDALILSNGLLSSLRIWKDIDFSFTARTPDGVEEVQIWAGIRCRDRNSRYVFGLRGGNNDHLYFARYAPEGGIQFLGIAPLNFHPQPGEWHTIRALARGNRFQIYLDKERLPRINVEDQEPLWHEGGVSVGGGWLPAEFRDIHSQTLANTAAEAFDAIGDKAYSFGSFDREKKRARQRATYRGVSIGAIEQHRLELSLDGDWLILPDQELRSGDAPESASCSDTAWHVIEVPNFWTPSLTWLHDETGFPQLKGVSAGKGLSDKLYEAELDRLDGYTFPWKETNSAWYRHHIDLPHNIAEKHVELCFDAVAKACEVWVNGIKVGAHIGMFGELRCDITSAVRPGANVLAVHVRGRLDGDESSSAILGIAVTVPVTASMLHSLPHGMYPENASGIWQPVKLIVTNPVAVERVSITPRLDGLTFELKVRNTQLSIVHARIGYSIRSSKDDSQLYTFSPKQPDAIDKHGATIQLVTPPLEPDHWSPQDPNLYYLDVAIEIDGQVADRHSTRFGFRTFRVDGNRLLLNERPLWLRGANHFPHALRPNDKQLAQRFTRIARDGNVQVTRSHTAPFTATWLDAADEAGMGVSYEGTWPWLMLQGEPPDDSLLHVWKEEYLALINKYKNHPSILFWTVNNEMKFETFDKNNPDLLKKKWGILSDMVKSIRAVDAARPVVCDSSYCRRDAGSEYETLIRPNGFDDGDIDDAHRYYGWYDPSFFHLFRGEFGNSAALPGRPLISQEMSTGYPRNDDGHPTRFYLFKHYTPQSLVGSEAYENRDPGIFLRRQAFMTKELAEVIRRTNRETCSGILHFAYVTWFRDVWDVSRVRPFITYYALKKALQPVLVSAELYGRHFYAGQTIATRVCIANDSESGEGLPPSTLIWELCTKTEQLARGEVQLPAVPYYSNEWVDVTMPIPVSLPAPRVDASLNIHLVHNGSVLSSNDYDITLGTHEWARAGIAQLPSIALLDPYSVAPSSLRNSNLRRITSTANIFDFEHLVIAGADRVLSETDLAKAVTRFVTAGGRVLLLNPRMSLLQQYPEHIRSYRDCEGEIVDMRIPESMVFSGIEPLDLSWFQPDGKDIPLACTGVFQVNGTLPAVELATMVDIHGYLKSPEDLTTVSGSPMVELHIGSGMILASEMYFDSDLKDPIAGRLMSNLLHYLCHGTL